MLILFEPEKDSTEPLYEQLANAIAKAIEEGRIKAGTALSPSRELAESLGLSRDTVISAYKELKRLAYVSSGST